MTSFGQDLIYTVSKGHIKTPKHVLLACTIKSLTGSAQIINILDRFGHGIAYCQVEEIETAIALQQLEHRKAGQIISQNVTQGLMCTLCLDNIDINEETLSGYGTTHHCNGILVQPDFPVATCGPPPL